jgi:hypothetical protein
MTQNALIAHVCAKRALRFDGPSATQSMRAQDLRSATTTCSKRYGIFDVRHAINDVQHAIMRNVGKAFNTTKTAAILLPLITQQHPVSLRLLDHFVTNYCRFRQVSVPSLRSGQIVVFHEYKRALSYYRRRNFDPFRRSKRRLGEDVVQYNVHFVLDGAHYTTTVGQLCFIHWAHTNGILAYVEANLPRLEAAMAGATAAPRALPVHSDVNRDASSFTNFG